MGYKAQPDPNRSERPGSPNALVTSAFVGSEVPLRLRRRSQSRVSRPAAAGLDGVAALGAVRVMGQLFLYSPMWF